MASLALSYEVETGTSINETELKCMAENIYFEGHEYFYHVRSMTDRPQPRFLFVFFKWSRNVFVQMPRFSYLS